MNPKDGLQPCPSDSQESKVDAKSEGQEAPKRLHRPTVPALEAILGKSFRVLDDGFVRLLDYMGNDSAIVQAARISYGVGTKQVSEDRGLIRYLMRHLHTTPFEMCEIKFHVRVPMDTWRQWIRHRTANVNEYSTRYSVAIDSAQRTLQNEWRLQSPLNRQGSRGTLDIEVGGHFTSQETELQEQSREIYKERLAAGVAREQARKDLPLSTYTEAYWKIDLHNLLHFLYLRMGEHAQHEIRAYAMTIGEKVISKWVPMAWEAFLDYRLNAIQLSRIEVEIITALVAKASDTASKLAFERGLLNRRKDGSLANNRERAELENKLRLFSLAPPWR